MIVALARKLLVALWRMVTVGEVPEGVVLRTRRHDIAVCRSVAIFLPEDRHAVIRGGGDPSYNMAAVPS